MRNFDHAELLCLRRVKYRFSFSDPAPDASIQDPDQHAFAYFCLNDNGGMFVCPTLTGGYVLKSFDDEENEDVDQLPRVAPDIFYDVIITFDWTRSRDDDFFWANVLVKGEDRSRSRTRFRCEWEPLERVELYNFSPGIARYTAIEVEYSEMTSRDGRFADPDSE